MKVEKKYTEYGFPYLEKTGHCKVCGEFELWRKLEGELRDSEEYDSDLCHKCFDQHQERLYAEQKAKEEVEAEQRRKVAEAKRQARIAQEMEHSDEIYQAHVDTCLSHGEPY